MRKPAFIRPLHLLGGMVILMPTAAMSAASATKHSQATAAHGASHVHPTAHRHERDEDQPWMMFPVALAAVSFAIRRQQRALDSLQPQVN